MKVRIFSIEEFSLYDGPGIRTTIFLKGCPLDCNWCHSPEGKEFKNISLRSPNGCIHCNRCVDICPSKREKCDACGKCIDVCPQNLIRLAANDYEIDDVIRIVSKNIDILNMNKGGITFSGGEPLFQIKALKELIYKLKGKTHLALQTSGYGNSNDFKEVIENIDLVLFDMKIVDKDKALIYEGIDNTVILDNFEILKNSNTPFIIRIPLIPGVTDTEQNINQIIDIIKGSQNMIGVEVLPYNKYAGSKYKLANKEYTPLFDENVPPQTHFELFKRANIKVRSL